MTRTLPILLILFLPILILGTIPPATAEDDAMQTELLIEFPSEAELWPSIDDPVMGGRSRSRMHAEKGIAIFEGFVSLENNGGFCSVRSEPTPTDLSAWDGVRLRMRGDGQRYSFRLRTDARFDGVSYQCRFVAPGGTWEWIERIEGFLRKPPD
jgi:monofunctional biosynthetic peptidoglycan transglycosylase